jgi:hypothetical protein
VCAAWLGHSVQIAAQHYLSTRDAHFDLAAGMPSESGHSFASRSSEHAQQPAEKMAQKAASKAAAIPAAQAQPHATTQKQDEVALNDHSSENALNQGTLATFGIECRSVQKKKTLAEAREMTPMGLEKLRKSARKLRTSRAVVQIAVHSPIMAKRSQLRCHSHPSKM